MMATQYGTVEAEQKTNKETPCTIPSLTMFIVLSILTFLYSYVSLKNPEDSPGAIANLFGTLNEAQIVPTKPLLYVSSASLPANSLALFEGNYEFIAPGGAHVTDYLTG
jgi:hypothetical protein